MKAAPADVDLAHVEQTLVEHWGIRPSRLEYLPVGFGDHHWAAVAGELRFFITLRDLRLDGKADDQRHVIQALDRTFQAVRRLKEMAGLPFIVPAIPSNSDATIVATASRFALSVYGWIDVQPFRDPDGIRAVNLIAQLHRASRKHPVDCVPEDFNIPHRHHLETALDELPESWVEEPFGERGGRCWRPIGQRSDRRSGCMTTSSLSHKGSTSNGA